MKDPVKLQEKLVKILRHTPALRIFPNYQKPWNEFEFAEVASIVQDFVNQNNAVIECDPMKDWLEEYRFFRADRRL